MVKRLSFFDVAKYTKLKKTTSKANAKRKATFNSESYVVRTKIVKGNKKKFAVVEKSKTHANEVWRVLPSDFVK